MNHRDLIHHLDNAEMTPELCHDLINFSFDCLQDFLTKRKKYDGGQYSSIQGVTARYLNSLKRLVRYHFHSCDFRIFIG